MLQQPIPADGLAEARILVDPPEDLPYQVVVAYLENCRKSLPSLKDAIERSDYGFVSMYGHRMKGCGAAYGFPKLTEAGASLEEAARLHSDHDLRHCLASLEAHLESLEVAEL